MYKYNLEPDVKRIMNIVPVFSSKRALQLLMKMNKFEEPLTTYRIIKLVTNTSKPVVGCTWYNAMRILRESGCVVTIKDKFSKLKRYRISKRGIKVLEFLNEMVET